MCVFSPIPQSTIRRFARRNYTCKIYARRAGVHHDKVLRRYCSVLPYVSLGTALWDFTKAIKWMKERTFFQIVDLSIDKINHSIETCFWILGFIRILNGNHSFLLWIISLVSISYRNAFSHVKRWILNFLSPKDLAHI